MKLGTYSSGAIPSDFKPTEDNKQPADTERDIWIDDMDVEDDNE